MLWNKNKQYTRVKLHLNSSSKKSVAHEACGYVQSLISLCGMSCAGGVGNILLPTSFSSSSCFVLFLLSPVSSVHSSRQGLPFHLKLIFRRSPKTKNRENFTIFDRERFSFFLKTNFGFLGRKMLFLGEFR